MKDAKGMERLRAYKEQFERQVKVREDNSYYRIRSNLALVAAAAALAIDYKIIPWKKLATFEAVAKCMRGALVVLETGPEPIVPAVDSKGVARLLSRKLDQASLVHVSPKCKFSDHRERREGDGFVIGGEIYVKSVRLKEWVPNKTDRMALQKAGVFRTQRTDTPTIEKKIGGIKGKLRYFAIDRIALARISHTTLA